MKFNARDTEWLLLAMILIAGLKRNVNNWHTQWRIFISEWIYVLWQGNIWLVDVIGSIFFRHSNGFFFTNNTLRLQICVFVFFFAEANVIKANTQKTLEMFIKQSTYIAVD